MPLEIFHLLLGSIVFSEIFIIINLLGTITSVFFLYNVEKCVFFYFADSNFDHFFWPLLIWLKISPEIEEFLCFLLLKDHFNSLSSSSSTLLCWKSFTLSRDCTAKICRFLILKIGLSCSPNANVITSKQLSTLCLLPVQHEKKIMLNLQRFNLKTSTFLYRAKVKFKISKKICVMYCFIVGQLTLKAIIDCSNNKNNKRDMKEKLFSTYFQFYTRSNLKNTFMNAIFTLRQIC